VTFGIAPFRRQDLLIPIFCDNKSDVVLEESFHKRRNRGKSICDIIEKSIWPFHNLKMASHFLMGSVI